NTADLSAVNSSILCVGGKCTVTFENFTSAVGGPVIFAASTPFCGSPLFTNGVAGGGRGTNKRGGGGGGGAAAPSDVGCGFGGLACVGLIVRRQRMLPSARAC